MHSQGEGRLLRRGEQAVESPGVEARVIGAVQESPEDAERRVGVGAAQPARWREPHRACDGLHEEEQRGEQGLPRRLRDGGVQERWLLAQRVDERQRGLRTLRRLLCVARAQELSGEVKHRPQARRRRRQRVVRRQSCSSSEQRASWWKIGTRWQLS